MEIYASESARRFRPGPARNWSAPGPEPGMSYRVRVKRPPSIFAQAQKQAGPGTSAHCETGPCGPSSSTVSRPPGPCRHERIICRASGVKFVLCGHGKGRIDLSAEHSMRITVGYGGPACGQAREL